MIPTIRSWPCMMNTRDRLMHLLTERSVKLGDFTLRSGARSSYYVDARLTTMTGEGQVLIGEACFDAIREAGWQPTHVGGLTLGADPISYAIAAHAHRVGTDLDAFTVRKEPKGHGTAQQVEGGLPPGAPVVVIEDSLTTGGSALKAVRILEDFGARILGVLTLVDREEGGRETIAEAGYELVAVYDAASLVELKKADAAS